MRKTIKLFLAFTFVLIFGMSSANKADEPYTCWKLCYCGTLLACRVNPCVVDDFGITCSGTELLCVAFCGPSA